MASGPEMLIQSLLKLAGVNTPELQGQLIQSIKAVLTVDQRLARIEAHLGIPPLTNSETQNHDHETRQIGHANGNGGT